MSEPGTTEVSWELPTEEPTSTPSERWGSAPRSVRNPWVDPPAVTDEMERLAAYIDAGGLDLIHEVEYIEPVRRQIAAAYGIPMCFLFGTEGA